MNASPSHFLFIILALLQLVTPLVHAHTGEESIKQGLHLPGYEHYSVNLDTPEYHIVTHPTAENCSIIGVATGIKHKNVLSDQHSPDSIPAASLSLNPATYSVYIAAVTPGSATIKPPPFLILPSRAPPVNSKI